MTSKLYMAVALILGGHILAWYGTYSIFVWKWCQENINLLPFIFAIPTQFFFLYGMKFAVEELEEVWGARLIGFGLSYLIFPLLTYYYFGENMFAPKTLICVGLSFAIVGIQVFWK